MWCGGGVSKVLVWIKNRNSEMSVDVVQSVELPAFEGNDENMEYLFWAVEHLISLPMPRKWMKGITKYTFEGMREKNFYIIRWRHIRTWHSNNMLRPVRVAWQDLYCLPCPPRLYSLVKGWDTKLSNERK